MLATNLESKDVDGALVRGAAKPLVPTAEVDAVDSCLPLKICSLKAISNFLQIYLCLWDLLFFLKAFSPDQLLVSAQPAAP